VYEWTTWSVYLDFGFARLPVQIIRHWVAVVIERVKTA